MRTATRHGVRIVRANLQTFTEIYDEITTEILRFQTRLQDSKIPVRFQGSCTRLELVTDPSELACFDEEDDSLPATFSNRAFYL